MGSMLISIVVVLLIAYGGVGLVLYFMQPTFLYSPVREVPYTPDRVKEALDQEHEGTR